MIEVGCWAPRVVEIKHLPAPSDFDWWEGWIYGRGLARNAPKELEIQRALALLKIAGELSSYTLGDMTGNDGQTGFTGFFEQQVRAQWTKFSHKQRAARVRAIQQTVQEWEPTFNKLPFEALLDCWTLPNATAVMEYIRKYGVFKERHQINADDLPPVIERYWLIAKKEGHIPFAAKLRNIRDDLTDLRSACKLHKWLRSGTQEDRRKADELADLTQHTSPEVLLESKFALGSARVGVTFKGGNAYPVIRTSYVLPGLYAYLWQRILLKKPMTECPKCEKPFAAVRPTKTFCSTQCQQATKQMRYRKRSSK